MLRKPGRPDLVRALNWSQTHHAEFELDMTALICATRLQIPDPQNKGKTTLTLRPPIVINDTIINPTSSCKFLGVIIDQELHFNAHAAYTIGKGTKYILACKRLTKPSKGICAQRMKKIYKGVAIPKLMYTSEVWATTHLKPGKGSKQNRWGARGFGKKIETVQCTAALAITRGICSTTTDLLLAHADLLPIPVLIRQHAQRAALQLATIPQHHPLHKHVIQALRQHRHHKSPLHCILLTFPLDLQKTETIQPVCHSTKWSPQTKIDIRDKDEAIEQDALAEETEDMVLYSDRLGHDRKIGGGAVLCRRGRQVSSLHFELGADTDHTVYTGEIVGMILAIELLKKAP